MKFSNKPSAFNKLLGGAHKNVRGIRNANAKRANTTSSGSALQARARLQAAFSEAPAANKGVQGHAGVSIGSASAVSIASLLKIQDSPVHEVACTNEAGARNVKVVSEHIKAAAEPNMAQESVSLTTEQIRTACIDHAVLLSKLKRIDISALATMLGMPTENVRKALSGVQEALRAPEWDRVIEVMGIDPDTARLSRVMPHFIHVTPSSLDAFKALESIFMNMRAARMQFDGRLMQKLRNKSPRVAVMQNDHLRVVLIEHDGVRAIDQINGVEWARGTEKASQVKSIFARERFVASDLTAIEFDTLFAGERRIDWSYVELVARANRVSMEDIIAYIQSVGEEKAQAAQSYLKVVNGN